MAQSKEVSEPKGFHRKISEYSPGRRRRGKYKEGVRGKGSGLRRPDTARIGVSEDQREWGGASIRGAIAQNVLKSMKDTHPRSEAARVWEGYINRHLYQDTL